MPDTDKLPIVCDDFTVSGRAGVVHIGFFARLAPYGSVGDADEERICAARVALTPEGISILLSTLEKLKAMMEVGPTKAN